MLAFIVNALFCEVEDLLRSPRMPRVVPDQREKFENDELFRKLSRESEVRVNVLRYGSMYSYGLLLCIARPMLFMSV